MDDGFLIDRINVYERLGHDKFVELSTAFYNRVYDDAVAPEFRKQFDGRDKAQAIKNQYEFFIQRMGGPQLYTQNRASDKYGGHPALRARHGPFAVTTANADRWIEHMVAALDEVGIEGEERQAMEEFLRHTAYFLRNRRE